MASHRLGRITEDIHRELTAIFREVKDPRVQEGLISIVRVDVTNDLSLLYGIYQCHAGVGTSESG